MSASMQLRLCKPHRWALALLAMCVLIGIGCQRTPPIEGVALAPQPSPPLSKQERRLLGTWYTSFSVTGAYSLELKFMESTYVITQAPLEVVVEEGTWKVRRATENGHVLEFRNHAAPTELAPREILIEYIGPNESENGFLRDAGFLRIFNLTPGGSIWPRKT